MTLPNFLIIGAAKSGTTALYRYLSDHPQVFMSQTKELHYFSYPETSQLIYGPETYKRVVISSLQDYINCFNNVKTEIAIGEASPSYLYFPQCANRIKNLLPNVKNIVILRNPIERAFSAYMHATRDGWEPLNNFRQALSQEESRIEKGWEIVWHYKQCGLYYNMLLEYYNVFAPSQILVTLYDELVFDPSKLFKKITGYLNIDDSYVPDFSVHPNVSGKIRSPLFYKIVNKIFLEPNLLKTASQKLLPESLRWRFTTRIRNLNIKKETFPEDLRFELIEFFRDDVINLESLIKKDLSSWLKEK